MKSYDLDRFVKLATLMSRPVEQDVLFDIALKECMLAGNCDGGTIYTIEDNKLYFRYLYTLSKGIAMNYKNAADTFPPVPMRKVFVCAFAAMKKMRLNIKDVYVSEEFDFGGAKYYDDMNDYRTCSMLVVPIVVGNGEVMGVLQLINAKDKYGMWTPFTKDQEELVGAIASVIALYLENLKLKGQLQGFPKKSEDQEEKKEDKSKEVKGTEEKDKEDKTKRRKFNWFE